MRRETVDVGELHIAIDIDAPASCLLPFQPKQGENRGFRTAHAYWNDPMNVGLALGAGPFSVSSYDKKQEVQDAKFGVCDGAGIEPKHMLTWKHAARIEIRVRPQQIDLDAAPQKVFSEDLLDRIRALFVADLRHLEGATPLADLVCLARRQGFIARSPIPKRSAGRKAPKRSDDLHLLHFGPWLVERLRAAGMKRKSIEKIVPVLHSAVSDALMRLSEKTPIDLCAIVEAALPRLQAELSACLETRSSSDRAHEHHAVPHDNAA